jgi:hypothetical protein
MRYEKRPYRHMGDHVPRWKKLLGVDIGCKAMSEHGPVPYDSDAVNFRFGTPEVGESPKRREVSARLLPLEHSAGPEAELAQSGELVSQLRPRGRIRTLEEQLEYELRGAILDYVEGVLSERLEGVEAPQQSESYPGADEVEPILAAVLEVLERLITEIEEIVVELFAHIAKTRSDAELLAAIHNLILFRFVH